MPQYKPADLAKSDALELRADRKFEQGKDAIEHADDYVFITVFFAAVLFFAGMSLRFAWPRLRKIVLVFGAALLVYGVVALVTLPIH
jgi:hypothetical protein